MSIYQNILCSIFNNHSFGQNSIGRLYFSVFLLTFLESLLLTSIFVIVFTYEEIIVSSKLYGIIIFLFLAIFNYSYFIKGREELSASCSDYPKRKLFVYSSYLIISLLYIFSLIVESTSGHLRMVLKYLRELNISF